MLSQRFVYLFVMVYLLPLRLLSQELPVHNRTQEVTEVVVNNGNQAALAQLLLRTMDVQSTNDSAQAYFQLRSFLEAQQIELVEAYFQLKQGAFGPLQSTLKTGRFALFPYENRYFTSHATANALLEFNLSEPNPLFPYSPFNVGKRPQKFFRFVVADSYAEIFSRRLSSSLQLLSGLVAAVAHQWSAAGKGLGSPGFGL